MLLLIIENKKLYTCHILKWHNICTTF